MPNKMPNKKEMRRSRPIPSLPEFRRLTPERQKKAYVLAFRSWDRGEIRSDLREKRRRLLHLYQEAAGWSDEEVEDLQEAARASA